MEMVVAPPGFEYRSPARAELDGVFLAQRRVVVLVEPCGGLHAGRSRDLGSGRRRSARWRRRGSKVFAGWAIHDRSQHRPGPAFGRYFVPVENYGALSLFWPGALIYDSAARGFQNFAGLDAAGGQL